MQTRTLSRAFHTAARHRMAAPTTQFDPVLQRIADYAHDYTVTSPLALDTARLDVLDSLGCAMAALRHSACTDLLGPVVPGTRVPHGSRVPGTVHELDPVRAAFNIAAMIRWEDFNDTWLAAEWGHPSDNLGGILAVTDWLSRTSKASGGAGIPMGTVLQSLVKTHEIQGVLALENSFNKVGLDHVLLCKVATAAVAAQLLGLSREQIAGAVSHAFVDGASLRTYRHAPNTMGRKSWAAGDSISKAVNLAIMTSRGLGPVPTVLTAPRWGFYDVAFGGKEFKFQRDFGSYVMENVLFKISFPAEFHAQTAVEAALKLHSKLHAMGKSAADIASVRIRTQQACVDIIDKQGPLNNYADRDHCIQYMVAVPLIFGRLTALDYLDDVASDPRIDELRARITCYEDPEITVAYHDPERRAISNGLTVTLNDGTELPEELVEYPVGHRTRRSEGIPLLLEKFHKQTEPALGPARTQAVLDACATVESLSALDVDAFVDLWLP